MLKAISWRNTLREWSKGKHFPKIYKTASWECSPVEMDREDLGMMVQMVFPKQLPVQKDLTEFKSIINKPHRTRVIEYEVAAYLIVPPDTGNYSHIGLFTQKAPESLQKDFWKVVADCIYKCMKKTRYMGGGAGRVWVTAHNEGVSWFHVRVCNKPIYTKTKRFVDNRVRIENGSNSQKTNIEEKERSPKSDKGATIT
jgi:hypothetical protein